MKNEKSNPLYYVDDIGIGVLISTATKDHPGKIIFPEDTTVTFLCKSIYDATEIANYILTKQSGDPITEADFVIDVNCAFWSQNRFSDEYEFKVV